MPLRGAPLNSETGLSGRSRMRRGNLLSFELKTLTKKVISAANNHQYHQLHKKQAVQILRQIETVKGKISLISIKKSNDYAASVLGWRGYAPWLYVYSAIANVFKEGWIPDNYYGKVVVPTMKGPYGGVSGLKSLSNLIFKCDSFPDIAYFVNGLFYTNNFELIAEHKMRELLFAESDKVVFKTDNSRQGKGVYFFKKKSLELSSIKLMPNGVFQKYIDQHQVLESFAPLSVATLRITTVIDDDGSCSVRACYLRLGRAGDT